MWRLLVSWKFRLSSITVDKVGGSLDLDFHRVRKYFGFVLEFTMSCSIVIDNWLNYGVFTKELSVWFVYFVPNRLIERERKLDHSSLRWTCKKPLTIAVCRFSKVLMLRSRILCHCVLIQRFREICYWMNLSNSFFSLSEKM